MLKRANIELIHYPTERMIAGYYTKPLQGSLFSKMRDIVMGLTPLPDEKRVGINDKVGDKMSMVSGASVTRSNNPDKNEVGGKKYIGR